MGITTALIGRCLFIYSCSARQQRASMKSDPTNMFVFLAENFWSVNMCCKFIRDAFI